MEIENKKLKLNFKNTFLIGMAFFSITLLWTVYGQYCPLMVEQVLRNMDPVTFPDHDSTLLPVGIIMALDNALALFMLPLFGTLSDKTKCKFGKRMIYVFPGMVAASIVFPFVAYTERSTVWLKFTYLSRSFLCVQFAEFLILRIRYLTKR